MKNKLITTLFALLLTTPLFASANDMEVYEDEYLNVGDSVELETAKIKSSISTAETSNFDQWGSNWGSKIPFQKKANNVIYNIDLAKNFPIF